MHFRRKFSQTTKLAGAFVKTPSSEIIEILALAGLDFICLDAEHSAFNRRELDWSLALARALALPALVRLSHAARETILQVLDAGASGIVVPHVRSAGHAADIARWAHYGHDGRGYAGSTRSAGFTTRTMDEVIKEAGEACFVIAQIEDLSAVEEAEAIASVAGIDALFFGAADLTVGMGKTAGSGEKVRQAFEVVIAASHRAGKPVAAYCPNAEALPNLFSRGVSLAFVGSDQGYVLAGARETAAAMAGINNGALAG